MGLILALLYAGWLYAISKLSLELTYLSSANFLFWWHLVWSIILGVIVFIIGIVITTVGGVAGYDKGFNGKIGALLGLGAGGTFSLILAVAFLIRRAMYTGGAYLLSTALTQQDSVWVWDRGNLIIGGLLLLVAIITRNRSGSSSSSSKST